MRYAAITATFHQSVHPVPAAQDKGRLQIAIARATMLILPCSAISSFPHAPHANRPMHHALGLTLPPGHLFLGGNILKVHRGSETYKSAAWSGPSKLASLSWRTSWHLSRPARRAFRTRWHQRSPRPPYQSGFQVRARTFTRRSHRHFSSALLVRHLPWSERGKQTAPSPPSGTAQLLPRNSLTAT